MLGSIHIVFHTIVPELWPLIDSIFFSPSISWEQIDRISPNFIHAFILTRSKLGLLHIIFHIIVPELWPLIYAKFRFCSISWEQIDRISPNLIYAFILTRSTMWLLHIIFCTFEPEFNSPWFTPKFCFCSISWEQRESSGCVTLIVFLLSLLAVKCYMSLPHGAMDWSAVYDCGSSVHIRTYFLTSSVLLYVLYKLKDCWVQIKFS